mmetsp:Transcript_36035/g.84342  ORF Transcript_36035/g.84342 Transcript_36035/m.84342 type:complete len:241 (-) Transcript_36035:321-1043(-)
MPCILRSSFSLAFSSRRPQISCSLTLFSASLRWRDLSALCLFLRRRLRSLSSTLSRSYARPFCPLATHDRSGVSAVAGAGALGALRRELGVGAGAGAGGAGASIRVQLGVVERELGAVVSSLDECWASSSCSIGAEESSMRAESSWNHERSSAAAGVAESREKRVENEGTPIISSKALSWLSLRSSSTSSSPLPRSRSACCFSSAGRCATSGSGTTSRTAKPRPPRRRSTRCRVLSFWML